MYGRGFRAPLIKSRHDMPTIALLMDVWYGRYLARFGPLPYAESLFMQGR